MGNKNIKLNTPALFILLGIWLYSIAAVVQPESIPYASTFQGVLILLIMAHAIECVVYRKMLAGTQEYLWVMFCGVLFIITKKKYLFKMKRSAA